MILKSTLSSIGMALHNRIGRSVYGSTLRRQAWAYLVIVALAELLIAHSAPLPGMILFSGLLIGLLVQAAYAWETPHYALFLVLTLAPLTRMVSMTLPLEAVEPIYWYALISVPLFVAVGLMQISLRRGGWLSGFAVGNLLQQLLVALVGVVFGLVLFVIAPPPPLIEKLTWEHALIPALILLICTGLLEEVLFRGTIQPIVVDALGSSGLVYVALLYAALHLGTHSLATVVLVFVAGLFWGWAVIKTRSLIGVTLSHGLVNILLFLVLPVVMV